LKAIGFNRFSYFQTLSNLPDKIHSVQKPKKGFGQCGFVVISAYKSAQRKNKDYRKFRQYERIRLLFKRYGYDMDAAREKVLARAGAITEPVLDVGTGPGRMTYALAKSGFRLTTVDIAKGPQRVARIYARRFKVLNRVKFLKMDAGRLKFRNNSFATVIAANLLHDVHSPKLAVKEMLRVARPKAKIIISDLNKKGRALVDKVYRINNEIHRGKLINLGRIVSEVFRNSAVKVRKYDDNFITTYVIIKKSHGKRN